MTDWTGTLPFPRSSPAPGTTTRCTQSLLWIPGPSLRSTQGSVWQHHGPQHHHITSIFILLVQSLTDDQPSHSNFLYLFLSLLLSFFLALSLIIHSYFLFLFLLISFSRSYFHCFPKIIVVDHKNCLIQYRQSPDWWAVTFLKEISELFTKCPSLFNLNLNHHTDSTWLYALGHTVFQKYQNCKSAFFNLTECAECTL